jgi:hypothetical protein
MRGGNVRLGTTAGLLAGAALVAACASMSSMDDDTLVGTWVGQQGRAAGTSIVFRDDGEAIWMLPDTFHVQYRHIALGARHHIDISGFSGGPLAGRTLYCVGQMPTEDTLRMDCEPGNDPGVRPASIDDAQAQVFTRAD